MGVVRWLSKVNDVIGYTVVGFVMLGGVVIMPTVGGYWVYRYASDVLYPQRLTPEAMVAVENAVAACRQYADRAVVDRAVYDHSLRVIRASKVSRGAPPVYDSLAAMGYRLPRKYVQPQIPRPVVLTIWGVTGIGQLCWCAFLVAAITSGKRVKR